MSLKGIRKTVGLLYHIKGYLLIVEFEENEEKRGKLYDK